MLESAPRILCVGKCCLDIVSVCETYPHEDTDQRSLDYYWQRGGNASNTSAVLGVLGANVEFMGTMIRGPEMTFLASDLASHNVRMDNCVTHDDGQYKCPVAVVIINKQNASRTMMTSGQLAELTFHDFDTNISLEQYRWIHFEGRPDTASIRTMLEKITSYNETVDASTRVVTSLEVEKASRPGLCELMNKVNYVFMSKDFAKAHGHNTKEEAVRSFLHHCRASGTIICPWGDDGAAAITSSHDIVMSPSFPPERLVDTLGAGDTFIAAAIHSLSEGRSLLDTVTFGCQVAGCKCGMSGYKHLTTFGAN